MLPSFLRLNSKQIPAIAKTGLRTSSEFFYLMSKVTSGETTTFAISISAKVIKNASKRNLIRRRLKAAIIEISKEDMLSPKSHLIVVRSNKCLELSFEDVKMELKKLLEKAA